MEAVVHAKDPSWEALLVQNGLLSTKSDPPCQAEEPALVEVLILRFLPAEVAERVYPLAGQVQ
jgi:hypothetical protein